MSEGSGSGPKQVWHPDAAISEASRLVAFTQYVSRDLGVATRDYADLWRWSTDEPAQFWTAVSDFFGVPWTRAPDSILTSDPMPAVSWFEGGRLNYVDQVFREHREGPAIIGNDETGVARTIAWAELEHQAGAVAAALRDLGVVFGDRVVGYLPDIPEAIVAFLATAALGAVWAGCAMDLAADAARDRLGQLEPTVLIAATGYHHRGTLIDRRTEVEQLAAGLPSLLATVVVTRDDGPAIHDALDWATLAGGSGTVSPIAVAADHPLWVLFSSGTTGPPKGIVHGHAGVTLEHLKALSLHLEVDAESRFFWYTTLNWMMWNLRNSALLIGATVVCYDGAPTADSLWAVAERSGVTHLGVSPGYLQACMNARSRPASEFDLASLRVVGCTGSVLPPDVHEWIAAELGSAVLIGSTSGGTDVVSGFAGSVVTEPIFAGEIAVRCLGVAAEAWSPAGRPVVGEVGELVVTRPMPSMPLRFWNDPDGQRYRDAYFDVFPDIWRHGDWVTVTERGALIIHGRSDATLNRHGIRMGSADIYRAAEVLPEVSEALVVGVEEAGGGYWMPMFVVLNAGQVLDDALTARIKENIRTTVSPRHVPDELCQVPAIPHTLTGKKLEVPVKNLLAGRPMAAAQTSSVDAPALLEFYERLGRERRLRVV